MKKAARATSVREILHQRYPNWRKYKKFLSPETIRLCTKTEDNGYQVFFADGNVREHGPLICPTGPSQPYAVQFRDTDGVAHDELIIRMHPNALSINYVDPTLSQRPPYPIFTVANGTASYFPKLSEQYPELTADTLHRSADDLLSNRDLVVFLYSADDGLVHGEYVAPVEMAHVIQQFAMIHRVFTYKELESMDFKTNTRFWCAPGLRRTLFSGNQNVTFFPEEDGRMVIISNSVYDGAQAKKPLFCDIGWKRSIQGGMACHASMAGPAATGKFANLFAKIMFVIAILCDSGRGKTELRAKINHYFKAGQLLLGFRRNEHGTLSELSMPFDDDHVVEYESSGDDGLSVRSLQPNRFGMWSGISWEDALFDRNSGAYGKGDLPELDEMQKLSKGWWELRMVNILASAGDYIEHWVRTLVDGAPSANPRVTYSISLLRRAGVKARRVKRSVGRVLYAFAQVDGVTAVGPWTKLSRDLGVVYEILGGPDNFKSKSVGRSPTAPAGKALEQGQTRPKFAHIGTNGQFNPTPFKGQAASVLARHANFPNTGCFLVIQEKKPSREDIGRDLLTAEKEIEYVPEMLLRDLLMFEAIGKAKIVWGASPYPFLGHWPKSVKIGKHTVPHEFFDPMLIYGKDELQLRAQAWFTAICAEMDALESRGIDERTRQVFDHVRSMYGHSRAVSPMTTRNSAYVMQKGDALIASMMTN